MHLIDQISQINFYNINQHSTFELPLHNPVSEIIWVLSRNDKNDYNKWFEFIDWDFNNVTSSNDTCGTTIISSEKEILETAKLIFNGHDRFEEKDKHYFNLVQPYQHHTAMPKEGVYVYSFALNPENFQPSGACNMSAINRVELKTTVLNPTQYKYDITIYAINKNIIRITAGLGGLVYAC